MVPLAAMESLLEALEHAATVLNAAPPLLKPTLRLVARLAASRP
jgi:signal transduction histidine kinase